MRLLWMTLVFSLFLANQPPVAAQPAPKKAEPRLDHYGDPLPEHAVMRIGTTRLRPAGWVRHLAFTSDSKRLVTANYDTGVQVWDVETGKEVRALGKPAVQGVFAISDDGSRAAVLESNKFCRVYDPETGKLLDEIDQLPKNTRQMRFSPDGKSIALLGTENQISIRVIATAAEPKDFSPGGIGNIGNLTEHVLIFSPDGKTLVHGPDRGRITLWDVATGEQRSEIALENGQPVPYCLAFTADSKTLLKISKRNSVLTRWDVATGNPLGHLETKQEIFCRGISPDARTFVSGPSDQEVCFWDTATGKLQRKLTGRQNGVTALAFSPNGKRFAAVCDECIVRIWDLDSGKPLHDFEGHSAHWVRARFTSDGKSIVSIAGSWHEEARTFKFWDPLTGKLVRQAHGDGSAIGLSADGRWLAVQKDKIQVRDLRNGKDVPALPPGSVATNNLQLSADGRFLLTQSSKTIDQPLLSSTIRFHRTLHVWDTTTAKAVVTFEDDGKNTNGNNTITSAFSDDDRYFAVLVGNYARDGKENGTLTIWELATGRKVTRLPSAVPVMRLGAFSPSMRLLACVNSRSETIDLLELRTGRWVGKLSPDNKGSHLKEHVTFSPDGRLVAAGTSKGEVILWNVSDEKPLAQFQGHRGPVESLCFSPDGKQLVTGGQNDAAILVWDVAQWTRRGKEIGNGVGEF